MPSKEAARRNRRKGKNKAYCKAHKDDILPNKMENYSSEDRSQCHLDEHYNHVRDSCMKSAESTKALYDRDVEKSHKSTADHSRTCYHKDLRKKQ